MSDDNDDSKTEDPTGKKLQDARKEGNLAQTQEAKGLMGMVAALILIGMMMPGLALDLKTMLAPFISESHTMILDIGSLQGLMADTGWTLAKLMAAPFAVVIITGILAPIIQFKGILWVPKKIMPNFAKLNPFAGIKRLFSVDSVLEFVKQITKLGVLGTVLFIMLWSDVKEFESLATLDLTAIMFYIHDRVYQLIFVTLMMVIVLAFGDYLFAHWRWTEKLRMTKQEVKDEHKQQEGDPQVKARVRSLRMSRARRRMMTAVPEADVIITNPTHFAVALKYDQDSMTAPVLVAKGADLIAKRIRDIATENEVPIVENPPLARALFATVELDQEVPPEHYKAVAEVIGYVMRLKGKLAN
jgi:flagellar biosynthetic protein FlhB